MMSAPGKMVDALQVSDLETSPMWQFTDDPEEDDCLVRPVEVLPAESLAGRVVGVQVRLANGDRVWGLIGNVEVDNPRSTEHFLTISVEKDGKWFMLSRYHDPDYATRGPDALARFLGLDVDEVFPIVYDLTPYLKGEPAPLRGHVPKEPRERLSRSEIIALALQ